ncbi:hypothetical protein FW755_04715 [Lonepinella koalarum]|uniref:Lipoprotein n=1 Tax=Lonepinella koalarum TaxID=53417 RepID=A0A4R1KPQ5_9PAST|nr:hypothetical protein [Lonepinella koalarum]MDH2926358.1 hypothetical protein [Lonepinella koalarum]TCK67025.1 hypothetical protein EV692_2148 [Lonepinella koalarum]TFJ89105.1 hypothetical protein E0709_10380 [Lonepinella koalarum]TYG34436.1 hypothetical protein FW755_04715 [Lonepinella koalarum]
MIKKFIFGLAIICCVVACASKSAQPKPKDPNELPNGIMQPVAGTGAVEGGGFMPEIQPSQMPSNMK